jgi:hypothetical protein
MAVGKKFNPDELPGPGERIRRFARMIVGDAKGRPEAITERWMAEGTGTWVVRDAVGGLVLGSLPF